MNDINKKIISIILTDKIKEFEAKLRFDEKSKNTVEKYSYDVKMFCDFVGENELCKAAVMEFKASLAENYEISSADSMIASINAFLRFVGSGEFCIKQITEFLLVIMKSVYNIMPIMLYNECRNIKRWVKVWLLGIWLSAEQSLRAM